MAETKKEKKEQAKERIITINLTEAYKKALRRRSPYAVRIVKDHVKKHTKANEVKIGSHLNEAIWERGIKRPARSVRVKVVREGGTAKAELMGFDYMEFRASPKKERGGMKEKLLERLGPKAIKKEEEEKAIEGKPGESAEKTSAVKSDKLQAKPHE